MKRIIVGLLIAGLSLEAQNADVLLQRAIQKETVDGDLKGAIALYQRAVKQAGSNRASAAKALLRLAECYEKQGDAEARKTYERITREFSDQGEVASVARARLGGGARQVQARKVWDGPLMGNSGTPSPDGRYLSFIHWVTGNVALFDLATRETRLLTTEASWLDYKGFPGGIVFSPDGKQVAYFWFAGSGSGGELRTQAIAGNARTVVTKSEEPLRVIGWMPGGTHLLVAKGFRPTKLATVALAGGEQKELGVSDVDINYSGLSPDGRYLSVTRQKAQGNGNISVVNLTGGNAGEEWPLVTDLSDDTFLGWAPEGNFILFSSNRTGSVSAYLLPVKDGKAAGTPVLVRDNLGRVQTAGFDRMGRFYYHPNDASWGYDVHLANVDAASGKLRAPAVKIPAALTGRHRDPVFSPDGKTIAYYRSRQPDVTEVVLYRIESGSERVIPAGQLANARLAWLADGTLLVRVANGKVSKVDTQAGKLVEHPMALQDVAAGETSTCSTGGFWVRESGKTWFVSLLESKRWPARIDALTVNSEPAIDVSPDCKQLAWTDTTRNSIMVGPAAGGEARTVLKLPAGERIDRRYWSIRWTGDGRYLFFKKHKSYDKPLEIWRVPAEGGEAVFAGITGDWLEHIAVNMDGSRITWAGGRQNYEAWVMENFLPR